VQDRESEQHIQREQQLWETRRTLYAQFMMTIHECISNTQMNWIFHSRPAEERGSVQAESNPFREALNKSHTLMDSVMRQMHEIALMAESGEVINAAHSAFFRITKAYDQAFSRDPDTEAGQVHAWGPTMMELQEALTNFREAARAELYTGGQRQTVPPGSEWWRTESMPASEERVNQPQSSQQVDNLGNEAAKRSSANDGDSQTAP
jgi:hypothetical protein